MRKLALVFGLILGVQVSPTAALGVSPFQETPRTAFVHLFEWKWSDVALECENFLGPKGFAAVQVSPPQEHAVLPGGPWYERYQPVSYKIESRSGTRAEFADMVRRCKKAGVAVYADAVINHTAWVNRTRHTLYGSAGTAYNEYEHIGLYQPQDFHHCDNIITNYRDAGMVQFCNIGLRRGEDCADLATESSYVRGKLADYLNDLLALGVSGFRIDAAKHIPVRDLQAIFSQLKSNAYIFQEVIGADGEPIQPWQYTFMGNVTEFKYGRELGRVFRWGKLSWLQNFGQAWEMLPSSQAVAFIDNHDTERNEANYVLTYKDKNLYTLANIFMLAWPYGYPSIMSSYPFNDINAGPPAFSDGSTLPVYDRNGPSHCFREWGCEHRIPAIANMVGFRNHTVSDWSITKWWSDGNNRIAFARGKKGYVVINKDAAFSREFNTGLPVGTYCDVISGNVNNSGTGCTGKAITVNQQGVALISVNDNEAVAIHGGAMLKSYGASRSTRTRK